MFGILMIRFLSAAAVALVACLLVAVTPAISAHRYHPKPVDFSMAAPRSGPLAATASGRGGPVVSRPLRAAKRFNLVGLTWGRGAPAEPRVAVRTRRDGGSWTRWNTVSAHTADGPDPGSRDRQAVRTSSPDWVGEADWVQYRSSAKLPRLRLQFMNVRGSATRADRARSALRRAANTGVVSVAGLMRAGVAKAGGAQPPIVSREAWGAAGCKPRTSPEYGEVKTAFVHHTVNANDYTRSEAPDVVLAICRYHRDSNGWNDIGYNFVVDRFGTIYEGRAGGIDRPVIGAQAQGYNAQSTGIANLGTFTDVGQTPEALSAVAKLIRWKLPLEGVPTAGTTTLVSAGGTENRFPAGRRLTLQRVIGHRDTGATSCPGNALYAQLPALRQMVGGVEPGGLTTRVSAGTPAPTTGIAYGRPTTFSGRLTAGGAAPPVSLPVQVQAFVGRRWKT
ncbi:MAG: peptidoglycan recognition protein family protein, partial [Thermoleophilaceae bacterium]